MSSMTTDQLWELEEIVCKAIPFQSSDCWVKRSQKVRKRQEAIKQLNEFYNRIIREATEKVRG